MPQNKCMCDVEDDANASRLHYVLIRRVVVTMHGQVQIVRLHALQLKRKTTTCTVFTMLECKCLSLILGQSLY